MVRIPRMALAAGAGAGAAAIAAAKRVVNAPPGHDLAARAEAAAYSGPWTHGHAEVNGVRLHYAEIGAGPLVILLHGFPQCWYEWRNLLLHLGARFHVVAPDMRGYNWSDKPRDVSEYTSEKVGADIAALIEHFGASRAHVVGHDWGGVIAWHLGARYSNRVDKLVVINAPHPATFTREIMTPDQFARSLYVLFFQVPLLSEAAARLLVRRSLRETAAPGTFSAEALDVYENGISQPGAATAMLSYYRAAYRQARRNISRADRLVERPTLVLWGMEDFALSPALVDGLERWVPNLRVERVEGCGHWLPEERPQLTADVLVDFLG